MFSLALGGRGEMVPGFTLVQFIAPGIIIFSLTHSAFESAAVPIIFDKMEGMIGDVFVDLPLHAPLAVLGFAIAASALFALIGMVVGLWADRWDNYSAAETFLILPIGLLSGAFFTLQGVPEGARWLFDLNPVFHAVQGFRYGFIGVAEAPVAVSAAVLVGLDLALGVLVWRLFALGYKIKA